MAENETEQIGQTEQTEQVEETQDVKTDETQEVKTEEIKTEETQKTKLEDGAGLIARIKAKFSSDHSDDKVEVGEDIPSEFTTATRKMNWSDEDTENFASGQRQDENGKWVASDSDAPRSNEELLEMIPSILGEAPAKAGDTSDKADETKPETKEEKVENSQDGEELKQLQEDVAALKEELGVRQEKSAAEEQDSFLKGASDLFDKESEDFEVFGKTNSLPKFPGGQIIPTSPQMKARNEVWENAVLLKEAGMSGDKALKLSLNAYKGEHLVTETKRIAIKGLKKREQTLGGKRTSHKASETVTLTGPETIAEVKRSHGQ